MIMLKLSLVQRVTGPVHKRYSVTACQEAEVDTVVASRWRGDSPPIYYVVLLPRAWCRRTRGGLRLGTSDIQGVRKMSKAATSYTWFQLSFHLDLSFLRTFCPYNSAFQLTSCTRNEVLPVLLRGVISTDAPAVLLNTCIEIERHTSYTAYDITAQISILTNLPTLCDRWTINPDHPRASRTWSN
jgi:hypothetical protein